MGPCGRWTLLSGPGQKTAYESRQVRDRWISKNHARQIFLAQGNSLTGTQIGINSINNGVNLDQNKEYDCPRA